MKLNQTDPTAAADLLKPDMILVRLIYSRLMEISKRKIVRQISNLHTKSSRLHSILEDLIPDHITRKGLSNYLRTKNKNCAQTWEDVCEAGIRTSNPCYVVYVGSQIRRMFFFKVDRWVRLSFFLHKVVFFY